jgi:hypothetical protein
MTNLPIAPLDEIKSHVYASIDIAAAKALFEIRSMVVRDRRSIGQKVRWMKFSDAAANDRADKRV